MYARAFLSHLLFIHPLTLIPQSNYVCTGTSFPSIIDTLLYSSKTLSHLLHTCTLPYAILTHPISFSLLILLIPLSTSCSPTPYFPSIPDLMGIIYLNNLSIQVCFTTENYCENRCHGLSRFSNSLFVNTLCFLSCFPY